MGLLQIPWPPAFCGKLQLPSPRVLGLAFLLYDVHPGFLTSSSKPRSVEREGRLMAFVCEAPTVCESSVMVGKQQKPGFLVTDSVSHSLSDSGEIAFSETWFSCHQTRPSLVMSKRTCCDDGNVLCLHCHYSSPMCYGVLGKVQACLRKAHFNFLSFPLT